MNIGIRPKTQKLYEFITSLRYSSVFDEEILEDKGFDIVSDILMIVLWKMIIWL